MAGLACPLVDEARDLKFSPLKTICISEIEHLKRRLKRLELWDKGATPKAGRPSRGGSPRGLPRSLLLLGLFF